MKKINNYLFQKRTQKYLSTNSRQSKFVSYNSAKSILILFESDMSENNPDIKQIITALKKDGKKVSAWGYVDKKEIETAILPEFRILHHKQTDAVKMPTTNLIEELQSVEYDLLIDLTLNSIVPLQYLSVYAKASCKAGVMKNNLSIYDFIINIDRVSSSQQSSETEINQLYVFNQIIFYLKSIQTKD